MTSLSAWLLTKTEKGGYCRCEQMFTEGGAMMPEERSSVYSARLSTGRTTYFLDVRQAVNGRYYLILTESRRNTDGSFDQKRLMVFEESLSGFQEEITQALARMQELIVSRKDEDLSDVRKLHPRAFMKWDEEEESVLAAHFEKGAEVEEIASQMGRTVQAVLARLEKLELIAPTSSTEQKSTRAV